MAFDTVLVDREGDVGVLTLNRPDKLNAISNVMAYELGEAVSELNDDDDVGAIVLTGAGRAFCSGADVSRFEDGVAAKDGRAVERVERPRQSWIELVRSSKPIVCAINGACIGAGLTRTLPCDVRIASDKAKFSMRFVRVGIVPEIGSTQILPQIVGLQVAADLMLSGRDFDAAEAQRIGLVLRTVPHDRLLDEALGLANEYAAIGPLMLRETKTLLYQNCVEQDMALVAKCEGEAIGRCTGSAEQREAIAAFREKRKPDFKAVRGG
jgi:enoyl-CoA hydratase/carnithine racemase